MLIITIFASGLVFVIGNMIDKNESLSNTIDNSVFVKNKTTKDSETEFKNGEILQSATTDNNYFKLVVVQNEDDYYPKVKAIKVFDKKTNQLVQTINVDCEFRMGSEDIQIGDYNFDRVKDISIFEQQYAGANTSDLYFAYDPKTKQFVPIVGDGGGASIDFDPIKKEVDVSNQCCAGSSWNMSVYKVINNKFILIKEDDTEWTDEGNLKSETIKKYDLKGNLINSIKK